MCLAAVPVEEVVSTVQAVLELTSMAAPKVNLKLRMKGFALDDQATESADALAQHAGSQYQPVASAPSRPQQTVTTKYDIEPLPDDTIAEERFFAGRLAMYQGPVWTRLQLVPLLAHIAEVIA